MQTNITNTTTEATTTTNDTETTRTPPTLADYLAARAEEQRQAAEHARQQRERDAEQERERYLTAWHEVVDSRVSAGLRRALELGEPRYIKNTEGDEDDYYDCVEAAFTLDGATWTLRYMAGSLYLCGPHDYSARLGEEWVIKQSGNHWSYNRSILDAIRNYPQWLTEQQQRQQEARQRAAEEARKAAEEAQQPRRYTATEGSNPKRHLLHQGAYVTVWYPAYHDQREQGATWGTITAVDEDWILLDLDNGQQQLINRRHIATIEPRQQPEPEPAKPDLSGYPDMTSDDIPF